LEGMIGKFFFSSFLVEMQSTSMFSKNYWRPLKYTTDSICIIINAPKIFLPKRENDLKSVERGQLDRQQKLRQRKGAVPHWGLISARFYQPQGR
jgi:hypothetical protein